MDIKKEIFKIFFTFLLFYFVVNVLPIAHLSNEPVKLIMTAGSIAVAVNLTRQILKFFTLPVTFMTLLLGSATIVVIACFVLDLLMPGFDVKGGSVGPINLRILTIRSLQLDPTGAKIIFSLVFGFLYALSMELRKGVSK